MSTCWPSASRRRSPSCWRRRGDRRPLAAGAPLMRVFVPAPMPLLSVLRAEGLPAPVAAHAVTGALREWYVEGDGEELEYAASTEAAAASVRLLAVDPQAPPRRVVVAAEVPDATVRPVSGSVRSAVVLGTSLTADHVVSVHVDDDDAAADVAAAARAVSAADAGEEDAARAVEDAEGHELLWYDVTELDDLLTRD